MSELTETIQLLPDERALILKHGYPFERLERQLKRWSTNPAIKRISMSRWELSMLIGEFSKSIAKDLLGPDTEAVIELTGRLEYAEQTGDGDLDVLM